MARNLTLTRTEAEYLVDLLENDGGGMALIIADDLRDLFGMIKRQENSHNPVVSGDE